MAIALACSAIDALGAQGAGRFAADPSPGDGSRWIVRWGYPGAPLNPSVASG